MIGMLLLLFMFVPKGLEQDKREQSVDSMINMKMGDTLGLVLASNPTTGYVWQLEKSPKQKHVILVSHHYLSTQNKSRLLGVGGIERWVFKSVKKGCDTICLKYLQTWEPKTTDYVRRYLICVGGNPFYHNRKTSRQKK